MSENTWNDPRITAYVLDELSGEDRDAFELELESSDQLAAAVEEARSVTDQLATLYSAEETPPLDEDRRETILGSDSSKVALAAAGEKRSLRLPLTLLAAAATLILMVGLAPLLNQQPATTVSQSDTTDTAEALSTSEALDASDALDSAVGELQQMASALSEAESNSLADAQEAVVVSDEALNQDHDLEAVKSKTEGLSSFDAGRRQDALLGGRGKMPADESAARRMLRIKEAALPSNSRGGVAPIVDQEDLGVVAGTEELRATTAEAMNEVISREVADNVRSVANPVDLDALPRLSQSVPEPKQGSRGRSVRLATPGKRPASAPAAAEPAPMELERATAGPSTPVGGRTAGAAVAGEKLQYESRDKQRFTSPVREGQQVDGIADGRIESRPKLGALADSDGDQSEDGLIDATDLMEESIGEVEVNLSLESTRLNLAIPNSARESKRRRTRGVDAKGFGIAGLGRDRIAAEVPDFGKPIVEGEGPGKSGDRFAPITENAFRRVSEHPLSTFSVDVDTASYSKVRDFLLRADQLPRPDAVRIEEMVNYFEYDYSPPKADADHPFAAEATITSCPWNEEHRLARVSLKGKTMKKGQRPPCNLVFLLDTSGSMDADNKLPLVIEGMKMLLGELREQDKVAITVYAGSAGLILDSISAKKHNKISRALNELSAGGSTDGGSGIELAYRTARDHFISDGVNRVILCTDGDFNVGITGDGGLVRMVEEQSKAGIYLSVLGFGMGNHNDAMLEQISGRGNGNYAFIDTKNEARKVLVDQTSSTLVTIAKNVKMQVEFNATQVSAYRLIGYENRILAKEDFNDDKKDAGEIGAGHAVTAFYELVPSDVESDLAAPKVDDLKYQTKPKPTEAADSGETMTLKLRYLQPDAVVERGDESTLVEFPVHDEGDKFDDADSEFQFAAAVAGFGMKLRRSKYAGDWTLSDVLRVAQHSGGKDKYELRAEFVDLVRKASELMGQQ